MSSSVHKGWLTLVIFIELSQHHRASNFEVSSESARDHLMQQLFARKEWPHETCCHRGLMQHCQHGKLANGCKVLGWAPSSSKQAKFGPRSGGYTITRSQEIGDAKQTWLPCANQHLLKTASGP